MAVYNPASAVPYPEAQFNALMASGQVNPASLGAFANSGGGQQWVDQQAKIIPEVRAAATSGPATGNSFGITAANPQTNQPGTTTAPGGTTAPTTTTPAAGTAADPMDAFQQYLNSAGYQFRLGEGYDAINANYAARGMLESGAAQKSLLEYGQNFASNEFGNYLAYLGNQQGVGLSAASALAGVGQGYANNMQAAQGNYANALTGLTQGYGNAQGQFAQNVGQINSNAAIANANNTNALIGGIGSSLSGVIGGLAYQPYAGF